MTARRPNGLKLLFAARALRHRNYRLFFAGQGISLIGTWISRVATGWLVFQLTGSAFMLGVVGFAGLLPTFLLTPVGGVLADRWSRHRMMLCAQVALLLTSAALAYFALRGTITVDHLIVLGALQGLSNAFDIPARQAFVVEMIENRDDLSSAIAMNSGIFNGARLVGPGIAGLLIAGVGSGWCFLIDAVSFLAVIGALLAMRVKPASPRPAPTHVLHDLREGLAASFGFAPIRAILIMTAVTSLMGASYMVLLPVFADRLHPGDAITLGLLTGSSGLGALAGAVVLAMRKSVLGLGRAIATSSILFGTALIGLGLSETTVLSVITLMLAGFGFMVQAGGCNTIVQTIVDDHKRGRVMSFFAMAFLGIMPFGNMLAGVLARHIGAPKTVMIGGCACLLAGMTFARVLPSIRKLVRPIYVARGILPGLPEGVGSAAAMAIQTGGRDG